MNAEAKTIYQYQNPRQFLLDRVAAIQKRNPSQSIRAIAKKMGMASHTLLVMLLKGKRPLRVKHAAALARGLGLTSAERLYLQALIQFDSAVDLEEKKLCQVWLAELNPTPSVRTRQLDEFELLSNWIHMAILVLADVRDFDPAPEAIARRLGGRATPIEVRAAIERLKSLGLIEFSSPDSGEGRFQACQGHVVTADDVQSAGAREYNRQVMALAADALERVPLAQREFQSFAISVPHAKLALAKELIRKFRTQFIQAIGAEIGDEVFQMNIQFFQLTESCPGAGTTRPVQDEGVDTGFNPKRSPEREIPC